MQTQAPRSAIKAVQQVEEADSTSVIDASSVTDDATNVQVRKLQVTAFMSTAILFDVIIGNNSQVPNVPKCDA
jgi:hypothetical protein